MPDAPLHESILLMLELLFAMLRLRGVVSLTSALLIPLLPSIGQTFPQHNLLLTITFMTD